MGTLQLAASGVASKVSENSETAPGLRRLLVEVICTKRDWKNLPIVHAHALDTSTDTDINHTRLDLVGNINAGLQTRRALSVQRAHRGSLCEASDKRRRAHLGRAAAGGEHSADGNVLNEGRVDLGAVEDGLEHAGHDVGGVGVLEAALAALGEGASAARSDDDLGVFVSKM